MCQEKVFIISVMYMIVKETFLRRKTCHSARQPGFVIGVDGYNAQKTSIRVKYVVMHGVESYSVNSVAVRKIIRRVCPVEAFVLVKIALCVPPLSVHMKKSLLDCINVLNQIFDSYRKSKLKH